MKKLIVDAKDYALFDYTPYLDRSGEPAPQPKKLTYVLGQVVYLKKENALGVVLGCICESLQDLRTDMSGMQSFQDIEPATKKHLQIPGIKIVPRLKSELMGKIKVLKVQVELTFSDNGIRKKSEAEVVTRIVDALRNQMDAAGIVPDDEGEYTIKVEAISKHCASNYEIPESKK